MQNQSINFEENLKQFEDIKDICKDADEFNDIVMKISLIGVIIGQVNEIFIGSIYNEEATSIMDAANSAIKSLQDSVIENYINNSKKINSLLPVPDIPELTSWVEEIHCNITSQLYKEDFCNSVIFPALNTISEQIIQFDVEEKESAEVDNTENKNNELKEEKNNED